MEEKDLQAQLAQHLADLSHKHFTISYLFGGILALVLIIGSFGGYVALRSFDNQLAKAEVREQQYDADRKSWQDELKVRDAERAADAQRVEGLMGQIAARAAAPLPKPIQTALKPGATIPEVEIGLQMAFKGSPEFDAPFPSTAPYVPLSAPQAQLVTQTKVDKDRLTEDLKDEKTIADLQSGTISSLNSDLNQCKTTLSASDKVIADYKRLAKKSKWKKFLGGAEKVAIFAVGAYIGHKV